MLYKEYAGRCNKKVNKHEAKLQQHLSSGHYATIKKADAPSLFVKDKNYQILTLKFLRQSDDGPVDASISYVFLGDEVYEVNNEDLSADAIIVRKGQGDVLKSVEARVKYMAEILESYLDEIEHLEDRFYERRPPRYFMDLWFNLKKDVSKIERSFTRAVLAISEFSRSLRDHLSEDLKAQFDSLLEGMELNARRCDSQLGKLDNLRHYFDSLKSDKLNENIYFLTLVSGVFLPMNLIVGFFGMNTPNLFFTDDPQGTQKILYILSGVFATLIFGLPLLRIMDQMILRRLLGRYNFYRRMSVKIDNLTSSFQIK